MRVLLSVSVYIAAVFLLQCASASAKVDLVRLAQSLLQHKSSDPSPLLPLSTVNPTRVFDFNSVVEDKCNECQAIVALASGIFQENSTVVAVDQYLDGVCQKIGLPPNLVTACEGLAQFIAYILPSIGKFINTPPYSPYFICSLVQVCHVQCCLTPSIPEQIHLALTGDVTTMSVTWNTLEWTAQPQVLYGLSADNLTMAAPGYAHTYTNAGWNGTIYNAVMTGLKPKTRYYYRVGDVTAGWSDVWSFRTIFDYDPNDSTPLRFAVVGDMGLINSNATIEWLNEAALADVFDVVLHVGDISYADGVQTHWDEFMRKITPTSASVPYMVVPGNHEIAYDFASYKARFFMPGTALNETHQNDTSSNMFYSINMGPIHFVGFSTESMIDTPYITPAGLEWMKADLALANQNRDKQPWIVVMGHRPLYCSTTIRSDCVTNSAYLRSVVEDVFYGNRVDLVIHGHVHNYERLYPVYNSTTNGNYTNPIAPVYVINGAAGNREQLDRGYANPPPAWSAVRDAEYGYAMMMVQNWTSINFQFFNDSRVLKDDFTILRTG